MALLVSALLTNEGRKALAKSFGGPSGSFDWSYAEYFQVGTLAVSEDEGGQDEPLPPNAAYQDIQSVSGGGFYYKKTLTDGDILFIEPTTIQFRCFLDLNEANGNPAVETDVVSGDGPRNSASLSGDAPVLYELGIYDAQDKMIAYGTFPGEVKLNTKTLSHLVNINF